MKFADKKLERKFLKDGFVILDIYNEDAIVQLKSIYASKEKQYLSKYGTTHSTCDVGDPELVKYLDENIAKLIRPRLNQIFTSYDYLLSSFLTKEPGENNTTVFHHDPTMIENDDVISAGLWVPLQDTNRKNGCLRLIKGSHRLGDILAITPDFPTIFNKFKDKIGNFDTVIELKAGQGVLFNNKLIHGAFSNLSDEKRIAAVTAVKSANCKWVYYHKNGSGKIEKYLMTYEDYTRHQCGKRPTGKKIGTVSHDFKEINFSQFLRFMFKNHPIETIKKLFNYNY